MSRICLGVPPFAIGCSRRSSAVRDDASTTSDGFCVLLVILLVLSTSGRSFSQETQAGTKGEQVKWISLLDDRNLGNWKTVEGGEFSDTGKVEIDVTGLVLNGGEPATGVRWTGPFPRQGYEIRFEGQRVKGSDFFCGLTFPIEEESLTLILGGWGGWVVGCSCIDGRYAIDNDTCEPVRFKNLQWYEVRLRVAPDNIKIWIDGEIVTGTTTDNHTFSASEEMRPCLPLGIATWNTTGAIRKLRYRTLTATELDR